MLACGTLSFMCFHILVLDLNKVLNAHKYLFMASSDALLFDNQFARFIQHSYKLVGVVSFISFCIAIAQRNYFAAAIVSLPCLWFFSYEFAGNSRYSVVYAALLSLSLVSYKKHYFAAIVFILTIMVLGVCLEGRNSGTFGLLNIPTNISRLGNFSTWSVLHMFLNVSEGVFVQGEAFNYISLEHNNQYKILSFSPLLSYFDNFNINALPFVIKFHTHVPMGATGEVLLFGGLYPYLYWSTVFLAAIAVIKMQHLNDTVFVICTIVFTLATYLQFTYSVRTVFRLYLFVIFVFTILYFLQYLKKTKKP